MLEKWADKIFGFLGKSVVVLLQAIALIAILYETIKWLVMILIKPVIIAALIIIVLYFIKVIWQKLK